MLYREIIAVCSQIHTKHINTLCVQNVELLNVKVSVHIVTSSQCVTFSVYMNTVSNADMISRVSTCPLPPQKKNNLRKKLVEYHENRCQHDAAKGQTSCSTSNFLPSTT